MEMDKRYGEETRPLDHQMWFCGICKGGGAKEAGQRLHGKEINMRPVLRMTVAGMSL